MRGFCALALIMVAFAHQPAAVSGIPGDRATDLAAYALPDGSLPVFCIAGSGDGSGDGFVPGFCDFCRIAGTFMVPQRTCLPQPIVRSVAVDLTAPSDNRPASTGHRPNAPLRGPPLA